MEIRVAHAPDGERARALPAIPEQTPAAGWLWIDVEATPADIDELLEVTNGLGLDALAVRDAVGDRDIPKVDDFGSHLLIVLHGLGDERIETYELSCFLTGTQLLTVRRRNSPALDALWDQVLQRPDLTFERVDVLTAQLADVLTRRLVAVLDAFDTRVDELVTKALAADNDLVAELTAVRADLSTVRQVVQPQREVLDILRQTNSPLVSDAGRRKFSDVFDVASRASAGLEAARSALAETLDAYRGAEARKATEVTKVLTVYAAIMLPLSLIAGFFGMNFENLPGVGTDWGWVVVTGSMLVVGAVSLGVFVAAGWIRRPSGREAGTTLGRGLVEAARAPVQVVGTVLEISVMPIRTVASARRTHQTGSTDGDSD